MCSGLVLKDHVLQPLHSSLASKRVVDMLLDVGRWDVAATAQYVPGRDRPMNFKL